MTLPTELCCPLCQGLMQSAVKLPCCHIAACKACALRKVGISPLIYFHFNLARSVDRQQKAVLEQRM